MKFVEWIVDENESDDGTVEIRIDRLFSLLLDGVSYSLKEFQCTS